MNKWLLPLNIVLLLAVAFLFIREFSTPKATKSNTGRSANTAEPASLVKIGYFEMDSVEENFGLMKEIQQEMTRMQDKKMGELTRQQNNLQREYEQFQANAPTMTQAQGEATQKRLQDLDNQIRATRDRMDQEANKYFMDKQTKILNMIRDFFADYNKERGYTYIFASEPGLMYLKDTAYNVTNDLLKGLNEMYQKEKTKTKN